jgi:hypothetical protein
MSRAFGERVEPSTTRPDSAADRRSVTELILLSNHVRMLKISLSGPRRRTMQTPMVRYMLAAQSIAMILASAMWWLAWHCPCAATLQDAAFWTGLAMSQGVIVVAYLALRSN